MYEKNKSITSKEHLLDIAEKIFTTEGYLSTPVRKICSEARINPAMIGYYFQSKEMLLFTIIDRKLSTFQRNIVQKMEISIDLMEQINIFLNTNIDIVFENRDFFRFAMKELHGELPQNSSELITNYFLSLYNILKENIDQGIENQTFEDSDSELLCYNVISTLMHAIIDDRFGFGQSDMQKKKRIKTYFVDYFNKYQII